MKYIISSIAGYLVLSLFSGIAVAAEENMDPMEMTVSCEQQAVNMGIESSEELDNFIAECKMQSSQGEEAVMTDPEAAPDMEMDDSE